MTRAGTSIAALAVIALGVAACGSEDQTAGIAESEVGETVATTAGSGDGEAETTVTTAGSQSSTPTSGGGTGTDAKSLAALTIGELNPAEELPGQPEVYPAELDVPNDGDIENAFGVDRWTFDAEAGQLLGIDMLEIDHDCSQDLDMILVSPSGVRGHAGWVGNGGCSVHGPYLLDEAGEYAIELAGGDGSTIAENTGTYRFVPTFLTELDVAPVTFDQPNDGEISEILGVDRWTLSGAAGDVLTVDILEIGDSCSQDLTLVLEDPQGGRQEVGWVGNGGCNAHGPFELELDGDHVLEFYGGHGSTIADNTGAYRFVPSWLTEREEAAAAPGATIDSGIDEVLGSERWTFDAAAGDVLTIEVLAIDNNCSQDLDMILEDPFGEQVEQIWVGNGGCQAHGPFELERDGTYAIQFAGGSGSTIREKTGAYSFRFNVG